MASEIREGVQIDGKDFCCTFMAYSENLLEAKRTPDPDQVADQPCKHCVRQHPYLLEEARKERRWLRKLRSDPTNNPSLDDQFEKLKDELPKPPAGQYECYFRNIDENKKLDHDYSWFSDMLEARGMHNRNQDIRWPYIILCETVENPSALCEDCVEVMHDQRYVKVKEFIEEKGSKQQKKLFTDNGVLTHTCMLRDIPQEKDLVGL
ncbi:uncharacterized protein J4E78_006363 [Alternaria triticimaculans]|uniref:uncharacterized protein n=1 Tax=Alternaria triticimaculans TaxID=297637 RepID=UPI0020C3E6A2|nr:uncharacterized protein J4E78_006363 [Alternaria triticimaculans]KAI4657973.1 hypothetical protein J4E78_006363 [Alternaria triticimaculans]